MNAMNAHRNMSANTVNAGKSMEKLSSGLRINKAGDDAAGLAISEKMRGQIRGLDQASRNSQDAISMIQTAEGALNETHSILQRMRELSVQSATDTNTADDRGKIQSEVDQLAKEITRISNTTEFNTQNLMAGGLDNTFQIGANKGQNIDLKINAMDAKALGVAADTTYVNTVTPGATGLTSTAVQNDDLGKGLAAGTYTVTVGKVAANSTLDGDTITGAVAFTDPATYNGATDETVQFKITGIGASDEVTAAMYSNDGGKTWNAATVNGSNNIDYKGVEVTIAAAAGNAVDQTATVSFKAQHNTLQLKQGATNIGAAVKAYQGETSVTIGDSATGQTMKVDGTYGSLGAGATQDATIVVGSKLSSKAQIGSDGSITKEAVTEAGIDVSSQKAADAAIKTIDNAINTVSQERSKLGAYQNRLEHTIANLNTSSENLTASESRIRDVDMAKEMMSFSKNNILSQAAQAMLAQANSQPQGVLQLLR